MAYDIWDLEARWALVLPANFVIEKRMDRRDRSITSFMTILPPTKRDPGMQYWETYASVGCGVDRCPNKRIGAPLIESPVRKYTSSMSISSMCGPIHSDFSSLSHNPIKYSSKITSFLIF
jgi:hypothetical protein